MQGSCLVGPRAGEGAAEGSPQPAGTPATPSHGRREDEGATWVYRVQKDSGLSSKVQRWGPSSPFQTLLSGPRALGPGASLHLVKFEEEFLKNSLRRIKSWVMDAPASQSVPSFSGSRAPTPPGPSSRLRLAISRPGVPRWVRQSPWKKWWVRSSRAQPALGVRIFQCPWGCRRLQHAQPQEALMDQQAKSEHGQDTQPQGGS